MYIYLDWNSNQTRAAGISRNRPTPPLVGKFLDWNSDQTRTIGILEKSAYTAASRKYFSDPTLSLPFARPVPLVENVSPIPLSLPFARPVLRSTVASPMSPPFLPHLAPLMANPSNPHSGAIFRRATHPTARLFWCYKAAPIRVINHGGSCIYNKESPNPLKVAITKIILTYFADKLKH